jgi:hypothetical protein
VDGSERSPAVGYRMRSLAAITVGSDIYSYIPLIPVVSFYLIYSERKRTFSQLSPGWKVGSLFFLEALPTSFSANWNLWATDPENTLFVGGCTE